MFQIFAQTSKIMAWFVSWLIKIYFSNIFLYTILHSNKLKKYISHVYYEIKVFHKYIRAFILLPKWTISVTSYVNIAMPDLQRYPWSLNLIKILENNGFYFDSIRVKSLWISALFSLVRNTQVTFTQTVLYKHKHWYLIYISYYRSDKAF